MKKIQFLFAAIAMVLIVGTSVAFTGKEEEKKVYTPVWYIYNGSGNFDDPSSYTKDGVNVPSICNSGIDMLCAVLLPDNGTNPSQSDLDPTFVSHIEQVVTAQDPDDPTVKLKEDQR